MVEAGAKKASEYLSKFSSAEYRHISKHTTGNKKYYYQVLPAPRSGDDYVKITMKSGSTYLGQVNDCNERHGIGTYQVIYGGTYVGEWLNGFKCGKGTFYHKGGNVFYDGYWEAGEPHGQGSVSSVGGVLKYTGIFKNGKTHPGGKRWMSFK